MSDIVISVENVSKQYRLGTISSGTLRNDLNRAWSRLRGKPDPLAKIGQENDQRSNVGTLQRANDEIIWALRDVSFEVKEGEVLGIPSTSLRAGIGRNGAGTLAPSCGELRHSHAFGAVQVRARC